MRSAGEDAHDTGHQHGLRHSVCDRREGCRRQVRDFFGGGILERTQVQSISMQGQFRALRLDIEERFGSVVGVTHQCVPWFVSCATKLVNRFQLKRNGREFEAGVLKEAALAIWRTLFLAGSGTDCAQVRPLIGSLSLAGTTHFLRRSLDWNSWRRLTGKESVTART